MRRILRRRGRALPGSGDPGARLDRHLDPDVLEDHGIELLPVHPEQLTGGLIAQWSHRYKRFPDAGDFLQVLPPEHLFCACHALQRRRPDEPPVGPPPESA